MKKLLIGLFLTLCFFSKAQNAKQTNIQVATWFESPKESNSDTIVFRLTKHVLVAGDDPAFAFSQITFVNASDFNIGYWRWCSNSQGANSGKYNYSKSATILLDFGPQKCKCNLTVLEYKNDKLKVFIKEQ